MLIPVFDELKTLLRQSKLPLAYVSYRSGVCRRTLENWLDSTVGFPRIDTMLKVAAVLDLHIELTPTVRKMVGYYPRREVRPLPKIPFAGKAGMSRHDVRMAMLRLQ